MRRVVAAAALAAVAIGAAPRAQDRIAYRTRHFRFGNDPRLANRRRAFCSSRRQRIAKRRFGFPGADALPIGEKNGCRRFLTIAYHRREIDRQIDEYSRRLRKPTGMGSGQRRWPHLCFPAHFAAGSK